MAAKKGRQYAPLWEQIKKNKKATIIAHPDLHPRIIQAVRKEKAMDIPFRNLLKANNVRLHLCFEQDIEKYTVHFYLKDVSTVRLSDL